jgi:diguanylate cyclase (GGDEF)-like protein/PAS domain S-box-containing protein
MRMGDLVTSVLNTVTNPDRRDAAVLVFDGDRPLASRLLYDSHGLLSADGPAPGTVSGPATAQQLPSFSWVSLRLANRSWLVGVQLSHRHLGLVQGSRDLFLTVLLGLSLSVLAALLTARLVANHLALRQGLEREVQAARERAQAAAVFDTSPVGIVVTDPNGIILRVNPAFTGISGYSQLEARGHKANLLRSGRHDNAFYQQMWEAIVQRGHWSGEIWNRHRNGTIRRHELNITAVLDGQEQIVNFVGLLRDVTERYSQERRMRHLATHDPLTGLANRTLLMDELQRALALAHRKGEGVALMFLDLNGFKAVNDRHGHSTGDALLRGVAHRLREQVRASDLLCRQGGDEFVLMLAEAPDGERLRQMAAKLLDCLAAPYPELPADVRISASVGVARWPDHAEDADGLLNAADDAMYAAKQHSGESHPIALARTVQECSLTAPEPSGRFGWEAAAGQPDEAASPDHDR